MSLELEIDRIYMTNNNGKVVFDTSKPMPHILATMNAQINVTFPAPAFDTEVYFYQYPWDTRCKYWGETCGWETVCGNVWKCKLQWVPNPNIPTGGSFQNVCGYVFECNQEWVCKPALLNGPSAETWQFFKYEALHWSTERTVGSVPHGIDADFLLANCVATRYKQGRINEVGPMVCGLPLGKPFMANNSSIIETVSHPGTGEPWLVRMMHLFVENGLVKVRFQHSNRAMREVSEYSYFVCGNPWMPGPTIPLHPNMPPPPDAESQFQFNITVQVGKFTRV